MKEKILFAVSLSIFLLLMTTGLAASERKQTLGVFGNANEDGVVDMRDVACVEHMILGLSPSNRLADANQDGRLDTQDIEQIQQIILEKEKELIILDDAQDIITIHKPVRRVIPDHLTCLAAMRILDAENMVAGIDVAVKKYMGRRFLQDLYSLPVIGGYSNPDYEKILSLSPDVYLSYRSLYGPGGKEVLKEKLPGVIVIETGYYTPYNPDNLAIDMRLLGYILDKREQAETYIKWYTGYLNMIRRRSSGLSENERPKVYPAPGWNLYNSIANFKLADIAGGKNICAGLGPTYVTVDPEWMIKQNPDVILKQSFSSKGYDSVDPSGMKAEREQILNRPELFGVGAVKKGKVYLWHMYTSGM
ncbi:MAG: hypothetical protein D3916_05295, partial [Candidatus Electrothrix sp. MAN1_4]|nr:hypothetical protein [Candidatus Electrothrix sp. MAN1_4]